MKKVGLFEWGIVPRAAMGLLAPGRWGKLGTLGQCRRSIGSSALYQLRTVSLVTSRGSRHGHCGRQVGEGSSRRSSTCLTAHFNSRGYTRHFKRRYIN